MLIDAQLLAHAVQQRRHEDGTHRQPSSSGPNRPKRKFLVAIFRQAAARVAGTEHLRTLRVLHIGYPHRMVESNKH